jgi:cell division protease FtsH
MVTEFGMSDALGPMRFGHPQGEVFLGRDFTSTPDYSEEVAASIDGEVRKLIESAHAAAQQVLTDNREILDHLALELMRHETLEAERVQELFADVVMWDGESDGEQRAKVRAERAPSAPTRKPSAAASQSDPTRLPGGPA